MKEEEVLERLELKTLEGRTWSVMRSVATTGDGLFEGLVRYSFTGRHWIFADNNQEWLSKNIKTPPQRQAR